MKEKTTIINNEIESRIVRFSCRASVKAGDELTKDELYKLIEKLEKCDNPFSCPHGRPTTINLSIAELEKKFKRTGW
jgi:DNA mismatch repair protein MutL